MADITGATPERMPEMTSKHVEVFRTHFPGCICAWCEDVAAVILSLSEGRTALVPTEIVKLAEFGGKVLLYSRDEAAGCDIDGGDIQDWALALGVLETRQVTEPCGEECICAEWSGDFPLKCYFVNETVLTWLTPHSTPNPEEK